MNMTNQALNQAKPLTREQWLQHAVAMLRADMKTIGIDVPPVQVSCSWPGGGDSRKRIGECWPRRASKANINELFISPRIEDGARVLSILAHELAHAVDDCRNGHKAAFAALGARMGLVGKATQMEPPPEVSAAWAAVMTARYGAFPHRTLDKSQSPVKKQGTRMLKCTCGECGAVWRLTRKVIDTVQGTMSCPACHEHTVTIEGE
jgi:hypothetical protein